MARAKRHNRVSGRDAEGQQHEDPLHTQRAALYAAVLRLLLMRRQFAFDDLRRKDGGLYASLARRRYERGLIVDDEAQLCMQEADMAESRRPAPSAMLMTLLQPEHGMALFRIFTSMQAGSMTSPQTSLSTPCWVRSSSHPTKCPSQRSGLHTAWAISCQGSGCWPAAQ
jgi:hypothetical protein